MTLFNIALKNIKKNFYNYFLYFASMIFSIMIYYTFTSIQYNSQILEISGDALVKSALSASSVVIVIFSGVFIWYSNSFFTRKRKKEVGLYSLLGVKKKQIGRMLFYENLAMGSLSLIAGILLGSLLSKLFTTLLVKMMGFDIVIKFVIEPKAIISTTIVFLIIFLITSIHAYRIIYRFKLIELFSAEKSGEREPKSSIILAFLSLIFIGAGYYIYLFGLKKIPNFLLVILTTLILTIIGTYLLFSSLTVFAIKLSKKNRARYYRGINMIGTSHLLYRIKSHSRTLATIAVLSASTLTALSVMFSMYYDINKVMTEEYPFTYAYFNNDKSIDREVEDIISKHPKNKMLNSLEAEIVEVSGEYPDVGEFDINRNTVYMISESKYNEIARLRKLEEIKLKDKSDTVIIDDQFRGAFMEGYVGKTASMNLDNKKMEFKVVDMKTFTLLNSLMIDRTMVVKDEVFDMAREMARLEGCRYRFKGYITDNRRDSEELDNEMEGVIKPKMKEAIAPKWTKYRSYYADYIDGMRTKGLIMFVGAFLGLVFLTATGSIIFFKQLSEANDDRVRYRILKNIGVNNREIKMSISKQMLFVFLLPLIIGATHSLVAITLLQQMLATNLMVPVLGTIGIYTLIYLLYYFLTVNSYSRIVNP